MPANKTWHAVGARIAFALSCCAMATGQCNLNRLPVSLPGLSGEPQAMTAWDPDGTGPLPPRLIVAGNLSTAGSATVQGIAALDSASNSWSAFGSSFGTATSLTEWAGAPILTWKRLVGSTPDSGIERWNGTSWSIFGGCIGTITCSLATSTDLYVGGAFSSFNGVPALGIARWNGTAWSAAGSGIAGQVSGLTRLSNGNIIAYREDGFMAQWNGTTWTSLAFPGLPVGFTVRLLCATAMANGSLAVGGTFQLPGGFGNVAVWNGTNWTAVGGGVTGLAVNAITAMPNGDLVIGGSFNAAGGTPVTNVARWNGVTWSPLGPGLAPGVGKLLAWPNGDVIAAGPFTAPGLRIARWNGVAWSALNPGTLAPTIDSFPYASIAGPNGEAYVGGVFSSAGGQPANNVARWDGSGFTPFGFGLSGGVNALAVLPDGAVAVGGNLPWVARGTGAAWTPLGTGMNGDVNALAVMNDGALVAGGAFTTAGGVPASGLARWNGSAWSPIGGGLNATAQVNRLLVMPNGDLIVSGTFSSAGGVAVSDIAKWDGASWRPLGNVQGAGPMIATPAGDLLMSDFVENQVNRSLARWNGATWQPVGTLGLGALLGPIGALPDGDLVGLSTAGLQRYDGTSWSTIDALSGYTFDGLTVLPAGQIMLTASGQTSPRTTMVFETSCPANVAALGSGCPSSGGNNELRVRQRPWLGSSFASHASGLPAPCWVVTVVGFNAATASLGSVFPQAGPLCNAYTTPDLLGLVLATGGTTDFRIRVPVIASLIGQSFHHQMIPAELDAALNLVAITSTNAVTLTIGSF